MGKITQKERERLKMLWFSRWLATSYADEHLDKDMKHQSEENFDRGSELSVLNRETGYWYADKLKYFEEKVFQNQLKLSKEKGYLEETLNSIRF